MSEGQQEFQGQRECSLQDKGARSKWPPQQTQGLSWERVEMCDLQGWRGSWGLGVVPGKTQGAA